MTEKKCPPGQAKSKNIVMIGCGNMGSAVLQFWLKTGIDARFTVIKPTDLSPELLEADNVFWHPSLKSAADLLQKSDIVVLAVKPNLINSICADIKERLPQDCMIISMAAGKSLQDLGNLLNKGQPVIRCMPNTPAKIGRGMTVLAANSYANNLHRDMAEQLMKKIGFVEWITDDNLMNVVTAVSGSGPAYLFYFMEAFAVAARKHGLSAALAEKLARQTIIGSAALADHLPGLAASDLRKEVTSPGGTTEAALAVFMDGRFEKVLDEMLAAAIQRGEILSRQ